MLSRHSIRRLSHRHVVASIFMLMFLALSTIVTNPAAAMKPPAVLAYACTGGTVTVLASNGYVYGTLYSEGRGANYLYTAPAGRGFRWCSEAQTYDGRWWVWGHSAVDSRDGWMLRCHLYRAC